jgi:hypothetical protein
MTEASISRRDSLRNLVAIGVGGAAVALGASVLAATPAEAAQPLMASALHDLQAARDELDRALRDKGGHRVKAIRFVDDAIAEVRAGMVAGAM